jgi:hypothetical protein
VLDLVDFIPRWSASPPGETVVYPALVAQLVERPRGGDPLALS